MTRKMPLLLDVDGVLRVYGPEHAFVVDYAGKFVRWAFEAFELKWFTSHTKREVAPGYGCAYYARLAGIDPDKVPHLRYLDEYAQVEDKWSVVPAGLFVLVDDEAVGEREALARGKGGMCFPPDKRVGVTRELALRIRAALAELGIVVPEPPGVGPGGG